MLRISSTFLFICCMLALRSQWSTDPNVPTPICMATDAQEAVTVLDDGAGGWYVLWRDARLGNNLRQVRGQHVLADGTEAWETDGRLLISHPTKRIWEYAAARFTNGDLGIAYCQGTSFGDSVFVMRFSAQGLPAWSAPSLVGGRSGTAGFSCSQPRIVAEGDTTAFVGWMHTPQGTNGGGAVNRVDAGGDVLWGFNGVVLTNNGFGYYDIRADGLGNVFAHWSTGNGSGSNVRVQKLNADGDLLWGSPVTPLSVPNGTNPNAYRTVADGVGGLWLTWASGPGDIHLTRIDGAGAVISVPTAIPVCVAVGEQARPALVRTADALFVAWSDGRPPADNYDLYVQKFNLEGDPQWVVDGVPAITTSSYIPHPRMIPTAEGGVVVAHQTTDVPQGLAAMRLNPDGTQAWPAPVRYSAGGGQMPNAGDHVLRAAQDGGTVAFWSGGGNNVYGAYITPDGFLGQSTAGINATDRDPLLRIWPVPSSGMVHVDSPAAGADAVIRLIGPDGRSVNVPALREGPSRWSMDLSLLPAGVYAVEVRTSNALSMARVVKE